MMSYEKPACKAIAGCLRGTSSQPALHASETGARKLLLLDTGRFYLYD